MGLLDGKVAIITGAGSGQGAAEARMFAREGAALVVVADLSTSQGEQVAAELQGVGRFVALDVCDAGGWRELVDRTVSDSGGVDVLVNNAGIWLSKGVLETSPEEFRHVVEVNQTGVFLGMWAVAPVMRDAGHGSIVNISSNAGLRGGGMPQAYAASKWAVRGMSRSAAWELAPFGVRVNAVCPGFIATPMIEGGDKTLAHLASISRSGRVGTPEEVARLVTFLASDQSSYISGAEVAIDDAYTT
ncbi:MAG TPA: glucose 1-dehydrogenase [Acidimicrobiales bacterium]|nr:glucose 1-dehydrogenase [Acidimicrobiales bacterium]